MKRFQALVKEIADHILATKPADLDALMTSEIEAGKTVDTKMNEAISTIGEKLTLRRFVLVSKTDADTFGEYLHMGGRIGVLALVENSTDAEAC